ncbi:acyl-CoA carboxylase subunit beta [Chloroflexi bacterium]|nr:methylmalonyl-CoA carboxyltransferase [Chloroflexota bacterium]MDC0252571.1 acyl-CoA carboxylase subunit beta [Chloroflexota bacterium]RZP14253.1 MAG: acyl-CoA carboxylase subunit beta [Chloroflexota bacterium]
MSENNNKKDLLKDLIDKRSKALKGGGEKRIESQKNKGKLTARERLSLFFDNGKYEELDIFVQHQSKDLGLDKNVYDGDSVVTGYGLVNGKPTFSYAQDFTVLGGSLSLVAGKKIAKVMDLASKNGAPIVGFNDSGGARIQEGVDSLAGYGEVFVRNTLYSGVVPQISVIVGPSAGGAVYSPAITDFIFMVKDIGQMYITGPDVVKSVTGEEISHQDLGGSEAHSSKSGVAHFVYDSEEECMNGIKRLLSFIPQNNLENAEKKDFSENTTNEELRNIIPEKSTEAYDVKDVINKVIDNEDFLEVHANFAQNIVVGFGRIRGGSVGIVANQPASLAGMLDINASDKAARFVRFCDAYNIPIITFVDVPGFMPGVNQEHQGIIRHGAKLIYAYAEATVPKISVILRKAYGGAYIVMNSKELRSDLNLAWPTAEIAVMGPEGAVNVISRKEISESKDPEATKNKLIEEYKDKFSSPFLAASRGYIDDVIDPAETRNKIANSLEIFSKKFLDNPPKKHGNIPL